MSECYVLIDYENVQPASLDPLAGHPCHIMVFTGARQAKLPTAFAASLQKFGAQAEYVQLNTSRANLMDFHITYYLGQLTERNPTARFYVIAKDKGYDPLIEHLKRRGIECRRCVDVKELKGFVSSGASAPKARSVKAQADRVVENPVGSTASAPETRVHSVKALAGRVVENLAKRKQAKPATVKALTNTIKKVLGDMSGSDLKSVLNTLKQRGVIKIAGDKVTYREDL